MKTFSLRLATATLLLGLVVACGTETPKAADPAPALQIVALAPTAFWLVSEIVESRAEVSMLWLSEGRELEETELQSLAQADLVVRHGAGLDRWAETLELDPSRLVDLSQGVPLIEREGTRHSHGEEGEHAHAEPLPATWHDPALVLKALQTLEAQLEQRAALDASKAAALRQRLETLDAQLSGLADTEASSNDDEMAYLVRRLAPGTGLIFASADQEGALTLEPLLPAPADLDYAALFERNVARIAEAATTP